MSVCGVVHLECPGLVCFLCLFFSRRGLLHLCRIFRPIWPVVCPTSSLPFLSHSRLFFRELFLSFTLCVLLFYVLQVFVEFEDCPWRNRSWVQVFGEEVVTVLVESSIVWATRNDPNLSGPGTTPISVWPALVSIPCFGKNGLGVS